MVSDNIKKDYLISYIMHQYYHFNLTIEVMMKKYILILLISIGFSLPTFDNYSFGMSENMGLYGIVNGNMYLDKSDPYYITFGSFIIPFMGGVGIGYRKDYPKTNRLTHYVSSSTTTVCMLPIMCSTGECPPKFDILLSGSTGLNIRLFELNDKIYNLQLGFLMNHALFNIAIDGSASNIPGLIPVINIKIER